jgi:signal transduction histidine kinase
VAVKVRKITALVINTYIERYKFLLLACLFLLLAMLIETNFFNHRFSKHHAQAFQNILIAKQKNAKQFIEEICKTKEQTNFDVYREIYRTNSRLLINQEMSFYIVRQNSLLYWSDNTINFPLDSIQKVQKTIAYIDNAWYLCEYKKRDSVDVYLLTFIKSEYPYQNEYIANRFHSDFNITPMVSISEKPLANAYEIRDITTKPLIWLTKNTGRPQNIIQRYLSIFLYFAGILFVLIFMNTFLRKIRKRYVRDIINLAFLCFVIIVRLWMIESKVPYVCYTSNLFNASFFASSQLIPSLGDLLIHVMLLYYFIYQLQLRIRDFKINTQAKKIALFVSFVVVSNVLLILISLIAQSLVYNSNIHLELYNLLDSGFLSFVSYLILGICLYSFFLVCIAFFSSVGIKLHTKNSILLFVGGLLVHALSYLTPYSTQSVWSFVFYGISLGVFYYLYRHGEFVFSIGFKALLLLFSVLFIQFYLHTHIQKKHTLVKKLYAVNLTNEQDPVAEMLLKGVKNNMRNDTVVRRIMQNPLGNEEILNTYLQKKYFSGFLNRYNLESTVCGTHNTFSDANKLSNCEKYFSKFIKEYGVFLPYSEYYFLNNLNGSISYFDSLSFRFVNNTQTKLYIELNSKRITQELGYPKLLLGNDMKQNRHLAVYSYAKYKGNKLLSQKGDFPYSLSNNIQSKNEFTEFEFYKYRHIMYTINGDMQIIVSHKIPTFFNQLVWFSYIFIYFFILITIYDYVTERKFKGKKFQYTFTEKIRFSLFAVLFVSLVLTGVSLVLINTQQQTKTQQKNVREKLQSILVELSTQYEDATEIPQQDKEFLESQLIRFSNVFFTDINVYNPQGDLFASSRPEVFDYKLIGRKINPKAYYRLHIGQLPEYVSEEQIGGLEFTSAYAVLTNSKNSVLGYVNLPYFTKQAELTQQITSLIVAILNIYVILLMLATIFAVFISNKITYPLTILRDKMKLVKVGSKNEKIQWSAPDEIGELIENYNSMIDQLDVSVKKLAESEREGAWREMAKQIAHEIKNPLTPIKLNLQLLNKAWEQRDEQFEKRLKTISKSIIEQIDALAETANSFSNFAKLTEGNPETIVLNDLLTGCITLFENEQHITFISHIPDEVIEIYADRDKMLRLFNNIIKNAIQAIPLNTQGTITITVEHTHSKVLVSIADTGTGITPEVADKLFEPYFTTKSTGSGFGLAISKKIIEMAGGTIWFTTKVGEGTVFFIELPTCT